MKIGQKGEATWGELFSEFRELGTTGRTVSRALKFLIQHGFVKRERVAAPWRVQYMLARPIPEAVAFHLITELLRRDPKGALDNLDEAVKAFIWLLIKLREEGRGEAMAFVARMLMGMILELIKALPPEAAKELDAAMQREAKGITAPITLLSKHMGAPDRPR